MKIRTRRQYDEKIETKSDLDLSPKSQKNSSDLQLTTKEQGVSQQKIIKLREALSLTQEYADSIIGELEVMNEKMQSSNEELMSINVESQTANDELTTARVEQQTSNEALKTLSQELETRNEGMTLSRDYAEREIICARTLGMMKPSALLINTARGPLVHEADLADALNAGRIAGAGLDVLFTEPPRADNPLLTARNCIITPHIAWATRQSRERLISVATENVRAFLEGTAKNVVV